MFADLILHPGGVLAWIVVGLLGGWLAGKVMKGSGYGIVMDLIMGLLGAFVGGFLFQFFVAGDMGFWGSIAVSFVGACVLIAIIRAVSKHSSL